MLVQRLLWYVPSLDAMRQESTGKMHVILLGLYVVFHHHKGKQEER